MKENMREGSALYGREDDYGDGDVPEIDTTRFHSDAADQIPQEIPARRSQSKG